MEKIKEWEVIRSIIIFERNDITEMTHKYTDKMDDALEDKQKDYCSESGWCLSEFL